MSKAERKTSNLPPSKIRPTGIPQTGTKKSSEVKRSTSSLFGIRFKSERSTANEESAAKEKNKDVLQSRNPKTTSIETNFQQNSISNKSLLVKANTDNADKATHSGRSTLKRGMFSSKGGAATSPLSFLKTPEEKQDESKFVSKTGLGHGGGSIPQRSFSYRSTRKDIAPPVAKSGPASPSRLQSFKKKHTKAEAFDELPEPCATKTSQTDAITCDAESAKEKTNQNLGDRHEPSRQHNPSAANRTRSASNNQIGNPQPSWSKRPASNRSDRGLTMKGKQSLKNDDRTLSSNDQRQNLSKEKGCKPVGLQPRDSETNKASQFQAENSSVRDVKPDLNLSNEQQDLDDVSSVKNTQRLDRLEVTVDSSSVGLAADQEITFSNKAKKKTLFSFSKPISNNVKSGGKFGFSKERKLNNSNLTTANAHIPQNDSIEKTAKLETSVEKSKFNKNNSTPRSTFFGKSKSQSGKKTKLTQKKSPFSKRTSLDKAFGGFSVTDPVPEQISSSRTGVLKNGGLLKSPSSSSTLTDSSFSNVSSVNSSRVKKVSFQSDITICDGKVVSTFSNGLRCSDVDEKELPQRIDIPPWNASEERGTAFQKTFSGDIPLQKVSSSSFCEPLSENLSSLGYSSSPAISDASFTHYPGGPARELEYNNDRQTMLNKNQLSLPLYHENKPNSIAQQFDNTHSATFQFSENDKYKEYVLSCESPVPMIIGPNQGGVLNDSSSRFSPMPSYGQGANAPANMGNITDTDANFHTFQTERVLPTTNSISQAQYTEVPPYYECCSNSTAQISPLSRIDSNEKRQPLTSRNKYSQDAIKQNSAHMLEVNDSAAAHNPMQSANLLKTERQFDKANNVKQLIRLRTTATDLKGKLNDLKNQQMTHMEIIRDTINEKMKQFMQISSSLSNDASSNSLRSRRARLDQQRQGYDVKAKQSEAELSEVEAAVEELRNEVIERRCLVKSREVESLVLQLSQVGRLIAQVKGCFSSVKSEVESVGTAEVEVVYSEKQFVNSEPLRIDEQLRRCKHITVTLFTLKKLANVQEARSRTPLPIFHHPSSSLDRTGSWSDSKLQKEQVLDNIRNLHVDTHQRSESIKALEMTEQALEETNYKVQNEERRQNHFLYDNAFNNEVVPPENELTASETSSIESLRPPQQAPSVSERSVVNFSDAFQNYSYNNPQSTYYDKQSTPFQPSAISSPSNAWQQSEPIADKNITHYPMTFYADPTLDSFHDSTKLGSRQPQFNRTESLPRRTRSLKHSFSRGGHSAPLVTESAHNFPNFSQISRSSSVPPNH